MSETLRRCKELKAKRTHKTNNNVPVFVPAVTISLRALRVAPVRPSVPALRRTVLRDARHGGAFLLERCGGGLLGGVGVGAEAVADGSQLGKKRRKRVWVSK